MMHFIAKTLLFLLALQLVTGQSLLAQDCSKLARKFERLDRDIKRAAELARSFNNERAIHLVMQAREKRDRAHGLAAENRCEAANGLIQAAFSDLENAARILLSSPIERLRREVRECLRRADDIVLRSHNKQAIRLLDTAKKNHEAAEQARNAGKIEKAVEHFRVAKTQCEHAIEMASQPQDRFHDIKRKFETLRERAHAAVNKSGDPIARRTYQQALNVAMRAEEALRNGNIEAAQRLINQSILLLLRTLDLAAVDSPVLANQTEMALLRLREAIEQTREHLGPRAPLRARTLLERAQRFTAEAEAALHEGHANEARWKIELAENMVKRARNIARRRGGERLHGKLQEELANTRADVAKVRGAVAQAATPDVEVLLRMAEFAVTRAEQAAASGFDRVALEGILAAQRFLARAERLQQNRETDAGDRTQVEIRMRQLDAAISETEEQVRETAEPASLRLLQNAKDIRQMATDSFQKGNYRAASEAIQVSFELLRKSVKNIKRN